MKTLVPLRFFLLLGLLVAMRPCTIGSRTTLSFRKMGLCVMVRSVKSSRSPCENGLFFGGQPFSLIRLSDGSEPDLDFQYLNLLPLLCPSLLQALVFLHLQRDCLPFHCLVRVLSENGYVIWYGARASSRLRLATVLRGSFGGSYCLLQF